MSVTSDVAESAEMHLSQTANDIATIKMVPYIEIPSLCITKIKPGRYHIMLVSLKHDLSPGDEVTLILKFEKTGELEIEAEVRTP